MDVKQIAAEAKRLFAESGDFHGAGTRNALIGFLEGVEEGKLTRGQSWLAELLIEKRGANYSKEEGAIVRKIFASGMCSEGEVFATVKDKSFVGRK